MRSGSNRWLGGIIVFLGILALGVLGPTNGWSADPGVTATTIKVGYLGDMTGPASSATAPYRRGMSMYFDYINKEKGGVNGRTIQFVPEDDKFQVPLAIQAFRKLVDRDEVFVIVGLAGSSQASALSADMQKIGIPIFGPQQTTDAELANPLFFTTVSSYADQCKVCVDYAREYLAKQRQEPRIAAAIVKVESGYDWVKQSETMLGKHGQKLLGHVAIAPAAVEAASQIKEISEMKPNFILMHQTPATFILFLKEAHRYGLKVPICATTGAPSDHIYKTVGEEAASQFWGVQTVSPAWMPGKGLEELRYVSQKYGEAADLGNLWHIMAYTAAKLFVEGLNRAGKDLSRKSFMAAVETIQNYDTGGLSAPFTFGPGDHHGPTAARLYGYDYKEQKIVPHSDWIKH